MPKIALARVECESLSPGNGRTVSGVLEEGKQVGRLARLLYPGGIEIIADYFEDAVALTDVALDQRQPVFEAAITYENLGVRCDVLNPIGENLWDLVEIKSATVTQDEYVDGFMCLGH
jgi:hypothetical protein